MFVHTKIFTRFCVFTSYFFFLLQFLLRLRHLWIKKKKRVHFLKMFVLFTQMLTYHRLNTMSSKHRISILGIQQVLSRLIMNTSETSNKILGWKITWMPHNYDKCFQFLGNPLIFSKNKLVYICSHFHVLFFIELFIYVCSHFLSPSD